MQLQLTMIALPVGAGFIALGRFLYGKPSRLSPDWVHANPGSKLRGTMTNFYSVMFIAFGGAALGSGVGALLPPSLAIVTILLELAGAILCGVYLRPKTGSD